MTELCQAQLKLGLGLGQLYIDQCFLGTELPGELTLPHIYPLDEIENKANLA